MIRQIDMINLKRMTKTGRSKGGMNVKWLDCSIAVSNCK